MAGWLNFSDPSRSVAPRDAPRCVFFSAAVSHFPCPHLAFGCWGKGCPAPKLLGNSGRIRRNMADARAAWLIFSDPPRSVAPRGAPWCVCLSAAVAHFPASPLGCWGRGCLAPKILGNFGRVRHNMADPRAGWGDFSAPPRSVNFLGAPRCVFLSVVVSHFPSSPFGCWGRGYTAPKLLGNFGRIRQYMADSSAGWLNFSAASRAVALRGDPRCSEVSFLLQ